MKTLFISSLLLTTQAFALDLGKLFDSAEKNYQQLEKQRKFDTTIKRAQMMLDQAELSDFTIDLEENKDAVKDQVVYATNPEGSICKIGTQLQQIQQQQLRVTVEDFGHQHQRQQPGKFEIVHGHTLSMMCLKKDGTLIVENKYKANK